MTNTWTSKPHEIKRSWWLIDVAKAPPLGRLASQVSVLLRGKHKVQFTPHIDTGDFVVLINAHQVTLTKDKWENKNYYSHSGYFGSLKTKRIKEQSPSFIIWQAVNGMLAKNKMRKKLMRKLKIFESSEHSHRAQKPITFSFNSLYNETTKKASLAKVKNKERAKNLPPSSDNDDVEPKTKEN